MKYVSESYIKDVRQRALDLHDFEVGNDRLLATIVVKDIMIELLYNQVNEECSKIIMDKFLDS